jgi:hypothetical protein
MTKDSEQNGSKLSPNLVCSKCFQENNFDLLVLFPDLRIEETASRDGGSCEYVE